MTKSHFLAGALFATLAVGAIGQEQAPTGATRVQVQAETAEAIRNGDIVWGEIGRKLNEISPDRYPRKPLVQGATVAEVRTELDRARRNGEIPQGESGKTPREIDPYSYPAQPAEPGLTRAQVVAETQAAIRAGDIQIGETGKTLAELNPSHYRKATARVPAPTLNPRTESATSVASEAVHSN